MAVVVTVMLAVVGSSAAVSPQAGASDRCLDSVNKFSSWEGTAGAMVYATFEFRPNHQCGNGDHIRVAYVNIVRNCGPYGTTGRRYTATARSTGDSRTLSVKASLMDSVVWRCRTDAFYGYATFNDNRYLTVRGGAY